VITTAVTRAACTAPMPWLPSESSPTGTDHWRGRPRAHPRGEPLIGSGFRPPPVGMIAV
jgi:hypothetical protein